MSGVFHLMEPSVKARRPYDSRRRREQAAQTRRDIEAAANTLFRERGMSGHQCRRSLPRPALW